jgi:hypothetical protein
MKPKDSNLQRLIRLARKVPVQPVEPPPPVRPGFATRIAARWAASAEPGWFALLDRLALPGCAIAASVCLVAFAARPVPPAAPVTELENPFSEPMGADLDQGGLFF